MKQIKVQDWFEEAKGLLAERYKETLSDEEKGAFLVLLQNKDVINKLMKENFDEDKPLYATLFSRATDETDEMNINGSLLTIRFLNDSGLSIEIDFWSYLNGIGYCFCEPEDEGYNESYDCCGVDCDWVVPFIVLTKKEHFETKDFEGNAKDIWNFDFSDELKALKEKQQAAERKKSLEHKKAQVESLLEQIKELEKEVN